MHANALVVGSAAQAQVTAGDAGVRHVVPTVVQERRELVTGRLEVGKVHHPALVHVQGNHVRDRHADFCPEKRLALERERVGPGGGQRQPGAVGEHEVRVRPFRPGHADEVRIQGDQGQLVEIQRRLALLRLRPHRRPVHPREDSFRRVAVTQQQGVPRPLGGHEPPAQVVRVRCAVRRRHPDQRKRGQRQLPLRPGAGRGAEDQRFAGQPLNRSGNLVAVGEDELLHRRPRGQRHPLAAERNHSVAGCAARLVSAEFDGPVFTQRPQRPRPRVAGCRGQDKDGRLIRAAGRMRAEKERRQSRDHEGAGNFPSPLGGEGSGVRGKSLHRPPPHRCPSPPRGEGF